MSRAKAGIAPEDVERRERVITQATLRAAEHLGISSTDLAAMIGVSVSTVSRMRAGTYVLPHGSKPFELAQLFLRLFRSLDAIVGSDDEASRSWLKTENLALAGRPIDLITTVSGLAATAAYLDARRAIV